MHCVLEAKHEFKTCTSYFKYTNKIRVLISHASFEIGPGQWPRPFQKRDDIIQLDVAALKVHLLQVSSRFEAIQLQRCKK